MPITNIPPDNANEGDSGHITDHNLIRSGLIELDSAKANVSHGTHVPDGGTTGQVLKKASNANGDVAWDNDAGNSGVTDHGALTGLADDDHTQYHTDARGDARYYTKGQVDSSLGGKANISHAHSGADITSGTVDTARLNVGTSGGTVAAGNHTHSAGNLDSLSDVTITTPSNGQVLKWNGTQWVNDTDATSGGGATDHGALTGLADDDHTQYHNDARGDARYYTKGQVDTSISNHASTTTNVHGIANTANLETTSGAQSKVDTHVNNATAAHAASAISTTGGNVQGDLDYYGASIGGVSASLSDHIADNADAHDASAISVVTTGYSGVLAAGDDTVQKVADKVNSHTHSPGNLDSLTDVTITTPSNNQVLKFNGTNWVNGTDDSGTGATNLDSLTDVVITSPSSNQVLKFNGTSWVNGTDDAGTGGASVHNDLTGRSTAGAHPATAITTTGGTVQGDLDYIGATVTGINGTLNSHTTDTSIHFALGTTPSTQAVGDSAAGGAATTAAKTDHKHAMPSFGTPGSSVTGDAAAAGSSANIARADHQHARESFGASASTQAFGDSASAGAAATPSRSDHKHAMPARPYSRNLDYSIGKTLVVENDVFRWYNKTGRTLTIDRVWASLGTVSSSGSVVFDVKKNGTTSLWTSTSDRPTVAASGFVSTTVAPNTNTLADGDYLRFDVISIGTGSAYAIISVDLSA